MTQDYHSFDGKELSKINDIHLFLDESGITKSDLFNNKGALLVLKGKTPPEKIFKMPVYTYIESIYKNANIPNNDKSGDQANPFPEGEKDLGDYIIMPNFNEPGVIRDVNFKYCGEKLKKSK